MLHNDALTFKIYLKACKRLLDLDTLNGHLNIKSSNRDYIDTNLNNTKGPTKSLLYNDNLENNVLVDYNDFMTSRFYSLTSLPSQKSVVSNFGQHDDHTFWQMTTDSFFNISYDRDEMKPLKHQWNKMLGPVSLSGVDVFSIQYDCIKGTHFLCFTFEQTIKTANNAHLVIMEWHPIVGTLMGFIMIFIVNYLITTQAQSCRFKRGE